MGADIYIQSLHKTHKKQTEKAFEDACFARDNAYIKEERKTLQEEVDKRFDDMYSVGYFRDSYNPTSIFWRMDLSWWKMADCGYGEKTPKRHERKAPYNRLWINLKGFMPVTAMKNLLKYVLEFQLEKVNRAWLDKHRCTGYTVKEWNNSFVQSKKRLEDFLQQAIDLKEPVYCSV